MSLGSKVFYGGVAGIVSGALMLVGSGGSLGVLVLGLIILLLSILITFWGVILKWGPNFMGNLMGGMMGAMNSAMDEMNKQTQDQDGKK